ncbi:hypothetical protein JZ751_007359 [Albula glossodonta]|uniref:Uncharacterized protein n=1 Tax=Albula glossodonta TaxID=121402 RepID=A0A8T2MT95_9TELE|nr:hypothetical protein JZ751_007359 [Albula glossodonta]
MPLTQTLHQTVRHRQPTVADAWYRNMSCSIVSTAATCTPNRHSVHTCVCDLHFPPENKEERRREEKEETGGKKRGGGEAAVDDSSQSSVGNRASITPLSEGVPSLRPGHSPLSGGIMSHNPLGIAPSSAGRNGVVRKDTQRNRGLGARKSDVAEPFSHSRCSPSPPPHTESTHQHILTFDQRDSSQSFEQNFFGSGYTSFPPKSPPHATPLPPQITSIVGREAPSLATDETSKVDAEGSGVPENQMLNLSPSDVQPNSGVSVPPPDHGLDQTGL